MEVMGGSTIDRLNGWFQSKLVRLDGGYFTEEFLLVLPFSYCPLISGRHVKSISSHLLANHGASTLQIAMVLQQKMPVLRCWVMQ